MSGIPSHGRSIATSARFAIFLIVLVNVFMWWLMFEVGYQAGLAS